MTTAEREGTNQLLVELRDAAQRAKEMVESGDFDYGDAQFLVMTLAEKFPALDQALTNRTWPLPLDWDHKPPVFPRVVELCTHNYVVDYLPAADNGEPTTFRKCTRCGKTETL